MENTKEVLRGIEERIIGSKIYLGRIPVKKNKENGEKKTLKT